MLGLILNGPLHADNPGTLKQFGDVPVLAQLRPRPRSQQRFWSGLHEQNLTTHSESVEAPSP